MAPASGTEGRHTLLAVADPASPLSGRSSAGGQVRGRVTGMSETTMGTAPTVTREDAGGVATVTLQKPGISRAMRRELLEVVQAIAGDESVRAVLLTGTGRAFCVGQDLGEHVESLRGDAATSLSVVEDEYNPLVLALSALRVPVVVGINGACEPAPGRTTKTGGVNHAG